MSQLRIVYDLGFDENGTRIYRRQTLPLVDDATADSINNFLDRLSNVVSDQIDSAVRITYETIR